ncbi:MAG: DNA polymerase IV [Clostridia bacterium]|nr:DNA polymerase IV [Clostridia bacterium]
MNTILHIDCNNAFLSWEAAYRLSKGERLDIRNIPSVIAGNPAQRKGIVLACSYPAKKLGIKTALTINDALRKCPDLLIFPPDYDTYITCSNELVSLLLDYSPLVERYSIDECFVDLGANITSPLAVADSIRIEIKKQLGFTVNIGVSDCKLLAKTASGFSKPDKTHSLYKSELEEKYFHLPIYQLFMVGLKTCMKLYKLGYKTIGQVARENPEVLKQHFNLFGLLIWSYANGIDHSKVTLYEEKVKGIGNSTTLPADIEDISLLDPFLLSLTERCSYSLRMNQMYTGTIQIGIKTNDHRYQLHQKKLTYCTDNTNEIYNICKKLVREMVINKPIRHVQVRLTDLSSNSLYQLSLLNKENTIDKYIDGIRNKYGDRMIKRAVFLHSGIDSMMEATNKNYPKIKNNIFNG